MNESVKQLWNEELSWIHNQSIREKTAYVWELALKRSVLTISDLNKIPFTVYIPYAFLYKEVIQYA
jgi:hypothetical protein